MSESNGWTEVLADDGEHKANDSSDGDPTPLPTKTSRRDSFFDSEPSTPAFKTNQSTSRLLTLPTDIILSLSDHLPTTAIASIRLTCRALNQTIPAPVKPSADETCTLTAINRYKDERSDAAEGKHRCALCKALYRDEIFQRAAILDPEFSFTNFASTGTPPIREQEEDSNQTGPVTCTAKPSSTLTAIPSTRLCAWHINRFIFPPTAALSPDPIFDAMVSAAGKSFSSPSPSPSIEDLKVRASASGWASSTEQSCMHCGCIIVCVCTHGVCGKCRCEADTDCGSCGVRDVRCWWKLARNGLGPRQERTFRLARQKWLVARAEEMGRFGWDGRGLTAQGLLDWGMVRVVKCARSDGKLAGAKVVGASAVAGQKRAADFD